jgi:hypothetical protein
LANRCLCGAQGVRPASLVQISVTTELCGGNRKEDTIRQSAQPDRPGQLQASQLPFDRNRISNLTILFQNVARLGSRPSLGMLTATKGISGGLTGIAMEVQPTCTPVSPCHCCRVTFHRTYLAGLRDLHQQWSLRPLGVCTHNRPHHNQIHRTPRRRHSSLRLAAQSTKAHRPDQRRRGALVLPQPASPSETDGTLGLMLASNKSPLSGAAEADN